MPVVDNEVTRKAWAREGHYRHGAMDYLQRLVDGTADANLKGFKLRPTVDSEELETLRGLHPAEGTTPTTEVGQFQGTELPVGQNESQKGGWPVCMEAGTRQLQLLQTQSPFAAASPGNAPCWLTFCNILGGDQGAARADGGIQEVAHAHLPRCLPRFAANSRNIYTDWDSNSLSLRLASGQILS